MQTFFIDEHRQTGSWKGVWRPICRVIRTCLEDLHGLRFDAESPFRIYCHSNRRQEPRGTLYFMQMHLPRLYSLDHLGWGVEHSRCGAKEFRLVDPMAARRTCAQLRDRWLSTGESKCSQPPGAPPDVQDYIFVPLQVPDDCVIRRHSPVSVETFLATLSAWAERTKTRCVFKVHPVCTRERGPEVWKIVDQIAATGTYASVRPDNIHSLLEHARGVFTLNSGVGFEALIHGKPVVTFGKADYNSAVQHGSLDALDAAREYVDSAPDPSLGYRFALHYIQCHCYWLHSDATAESRLAVYLEQQLKALRQSSSVAPPAPPSPIPPAPAPMPLAPSPLPAPPNLVTRSAPFIDALRERFSRFKTDSLTTISPDELKHHVTSLQGQVAPEIEGYAVDELDQQRDLSIKFHWGHTHDFGTFRMAGRMGERHIALLANFMAMFGFTPSLFEGKRILDVGCWTGGTTLMLSTLGERVVSIEEVRKYAETAQFLVTAFGLQDRARVLPASIYDLNTPEYYDSFDVAFFPGVLYHLSDPLIATRILFNALKPGGLILLETAGIDTPQPFCRFEGSMVFGDGTREQLNRTGWNWFLPSRSALQRIMAEAGFDEIETVWHPTNGRLYALGRKISQRGICKAGLSVPSIR